MKVRSINQAIRWAESIETWADEEYRLASDPDEESAWEGISASARNIADDLATLRDGSRQSGGRP